MAARTPSIRPLPLVLALALVAAALAPAAAGAEAPGAPTGNETSPHFLLGTYALSPKHAILDGDTIRVVGLDHTLRLLGIDTEEIYHHAGRKQLADRDFAAYYKQVRGRGRPVKTGTPMGVAATRWAERFFKGIHDVRLEYDGLDRKHGYYDRYLVYVFAKKHGHWVNYNLAAVRAGMAPYFVKYGRLARFDAAFRKAQQAARAEHLGIWSPKTRHYPDYPERLKWWRERAQALAHFKAAHGHDPHYVELGNHGAMERLKGMKGQVVTVFGAAGELRRKKAPWLFPIEHHLGHDFELVAFTDKQLKWLDPEKWEGEYVYATGKVSLYHGRPEMKAEDVKKIWRE